MIKDFRRYIRAVTILSVMYWTETVPRDIGRLVQEAREYVEALHPDKWIDWEWSEQDRTVQ